MKRPIRFTVFSVEIPSRSRWSPRIFQNWSDKTLWCGSIAGCGRRMRNTKIVATVGPASRSPEMLQGLLDAGVDVFRINASHGTFGDHSAAIRLIRELAAKCGRAPAILLDLQGPKIRLGDFENGAA